MKSYSNGPITDNERSRTDVFCCVVFGILLVSMFGLAVHTWTQTNFAKLTTPYDSDGKACGVDYPQYPYIYFVSPHSDSLWVTVCVKTCPKGTEAKLDCQPNSAAGCSPVNSAVNEKAVQVYSTFHLKSICMPSSAKIQTAISSAIAATSITGKIAALNTSWPVILYSIPITILFSALFMLLMRYLAGFFVHSLFGLSVVVFLSFGIYLMASQSPESIGSVSINPVFLKILGGVLLVVGILIIVLAICYRRRIDIAAAMTQVAARFVNENFLIALLPFLMFVCMTLFVGLWIVEGLGYYSMGIPEKRHPKQLPFQHFQSTDSVKAILLVHLFQFFWGMFFLLSTIDFLVAGTATSWYFLRENPFSESKHRYLNFHVGSVAMGSFFLALLSFLKFIYELLRTDEEENQEGCLGCIRKFCNCCCFVCVTWLFNWFNNGAYTYTHLTGESYCSSACEVVALRIQQPVATAIVSFMEAFFSILVKLGIIAATCGLCAVIIKNIEPYKSEISDLTFPLILVGFISFVVISFFVSLYAEAMEAVYVCFLADSTAGGWDDKAPKELFELLTEVKKENHFIE